MPLAKTTTQTRRKVTIRKAGKGTGIKRAVAKRAPRQSVTTVKLPAAPVRSLMDLDELILPSVRVDGLTASSKELPEPIISVPIRSRLSFYMGAFFGAIVVQVLIVVLLAAGSA